MQLAASFRFTSNEFLKNPLDSLRARDDENYRDFLLKSLISRLSKGKSDKSPERGDVSV